MSEKHSVTIDELLKNSLAQDIISNDSPEMLERRAFVPPVCEVFKHPHTTATDDDRYVFELDLETRKSLPGIIDNKVQAIHFNGHNPECVKQFTKKRTVGIVFSGGPAPGGHNVIAGLYDALKKANPESRLLGFLLGPDGIIDGDIVELTDDCVNAYRNLGGFSMIKTGRTKIDSKQKMDLSRQTCKKLGLEAIVVVGGDDSNTNAAFMAQEFLQDGVQVIGVPKTIDGDIQVRDSKGQELCAVSFGFHSAARSYAKNISDLCTDGGSDVKYWHFCKVMGRVASHIPLEVALQTHANLTLIGEELADYVDEKRVAKAKEEGVNDYTAYGITLRHLSRVVCKAIVDRAAVGKNYGVVVIPEGVLEFINEIQIFIIKLNTIISDYNDIHDEDFHKEFPRLEDKLEYLRRLVRGIRSSRPASIWNARDDELFNDIPDFFQEGLLTERDSHGNFQFSQVETEKIILRLVKDYLHILKEKGRYKVGIDNGFFKKTMDREGLDPDKIGPVMFKNYNGESHFLVKEDIISHKTLRNTLEKGDIVGVGQPVPSVLMKIYEMSVPHMKTQTHFYGYDGRGSDPTRFDCIYTHNLGMTVFSLIASGTTGQMAAIKHLDKDIHEWEPIGIPIAPLMRLEERGGKMSLVIEKSVVDLNSNAFRIVKSMRKKWLAATPGKDNYRKPGPVRFAGFSEEEKPMSLILNAMK